MEFEDKGLKTLLSLSLFADICQHLQGQQSVVGAQPEWQAP